MSAVMRSIAGITIATALSTAVLPVRADDLPAWLAAAAARPTPAWSTAAAVVLHHEALVTVPRAGRTTTTVRRAVRIVRRDGGESLALGVAYWSSTSTIKQTHAWILRPGQKPLHLGRKELVDRSFGESWSLYSEARLLLFDPPTVEEGAIYAWESVIEEESLLDQWSWSCAEDVPVLLSRFTLTLPEGPEPSVVELRGRPFVARQDGRTWSWSYADEEWIPAESLAPPEDRARAAIAINVADGPGKAHFADWAAVATWLDGLMAPQAHPTPEVTRRAEELVRTAPDSLEQVRVLGREVQKLNYVSISLGLARGEGYRPHPAAQVLAMGYGDCKDKATLLASLLTASGHAAWPLAVSSEGPEHVDARWPSPTQFNHCIVAISAPAGSAVPASFDHPQLGRLIAFDPTDPYTAFGDLPTAEQGAYALLVDSRSGGLVRLPELPHAQNRTVRTIRASLDAEGGLAVALVENSTGQAAAAERVSYRRSSPAEYRTSLEKWLVAGGKRIELGAMSVVDDSSTGDFRLRLDYQAPYFARVVQGRMMLFRAAVVSPRSSVSLPDAARSRPIALKARSLSESVTVELPPGFAVDEIPAAIRLDEDFGSFEARWSVSGTTLEFTRQWQTRAKTLPPDRYPAVRALYEASASAIDAPVVLVRQ